MKRVLLFLVTMLALASCGDEDGPAGLGAPPESEFVKQLYKGPPWPEDVVVDPATGDVSYLGFNESSGRRLPCVATAAEAESLAIEAGFWLVGEARESDLYFEFDNARDGYGRSIVRVYRSSFLDSLTIGGLWGIDWPGGGVRTVGPIVYRPLNPPVVLDLLDHLWIQHLYHGGSVLLRRQLEDRENEIVLTTHEASIVFGDFGVCDVIHQMITTYTVWKETGSVSTTRFVLPEVMGRCR